MEEHRVKPGLLLLAVMIGALLPSILHAHPIPVAQARLQINTQASTYDLLVECDVTHLVMGSRPGHLDPDMAAQLAALTEDEMARQIERVRDWFAGQLEVTVDKALIEHAAIDFPDHAAIRRTQLDNEGAIRTQLSPVRITGRLPDGAQVMVLRLPREIGRVVLTANLDAMALPPQLLAAGQPGRPLPLSEDAAAELAEPGIPPEVITAGQFLALGVWHIIPEGLDHILFVLGLFLLSPTLKPILWQVTAFTIAHSVTLSLAMYDVVRLPSDIVEPLIAASIAFIAIENIFTSKLKPWRPIVVFAFGLLHGLGFAGVLSDLELPAGQFVPAIVGFNIGVEVGQLAVIGIAFLVVGWLRNTKAYRPAIIIPASLAIAAIGIYWTIERTMGG